MIDVVTGLALAGRIFARAEYAIRAADWVRVWFINPATRMNPGMRFAQINPENPGEDNDRGIVDFRDFWALCDAFRMLSRAGALKPEEKAALKEWARAFVAELAARGSQAKRTNNLGIWHDVVMASLAGYAGDTATLASVLSRAPIRLYNQVRPWGVQPAELARARPLHYSLFSLQALIALAWIGRKSGIDVWNYAASSHRSIPMAARFLAMNRTMFADYAGAPSHFDDRIEAALRAIPPDAADAEALEGIPRQAIAEPMALGAPEGFAPAWPLFLASPAESASLMRKAAAQPAA
jgi:hypothetical protein